MFSFWLPRIKRSKGVIMLVSEFHEQVWWPRCLERLRECTQESYHCAWKNWIEPRFGSMDLHDISPRILDDWIIKKKISPNVWRITKAFIRMAYKYELIERDPCDKVLNAPSKRKPMPRTLTHDEMVTLMDGLSGTVVYAVVVCGCTLGLRREEACGLMWSDFDWERRTVRIERGVQFVHGREVTVDPKTPLSQRTLPLPSETVKRLYPVRGEGRLLGEYHVHQIANRYRTLCKQRDLPYVPMSNLRTSWCTMMVNNGMPVSKVSRYMGHADTETTMRWYTKPREDELDEIAKAWGAS